MHQMQLADEVAETIGHQHEEQRMVEHLRGQLAAIKGSEMNMIAEIGHRDLEHKTEMHGYTLEINEKEMRAKQFQYRVMSEATKTIEEAATELQKQSKEEQPQLKEANFALAEANRILKKENLLRASTTDSRERKVLEEKFQELDKNQHIAEKKLVEARSENAKMKAETEMRHGPMRDDSRDGRGLPTSRSDEEDHSCLKEDIKHQESEVHRLRRERDEVYDWYWHTEDFNSYGEEFEEAQEYEKVNAELKQRLPPH